MSAISWLFQASGLKSGDTVYNGNDPSAPDPAQVAADAMKSREERLRQRETGVGAAQLQDYVDQASARAAAMEQIAVPVGVVLREYPELARAMAEGRGSIEVVGCYGPGDGPAEALAMRRIRDEGIAKAIRAGELPPDYVERSGAVEVL